MHEFPENEPAKTYFEKLFATCGELNMEQLRVLLECAEQIRVTPLKVFDRSPVLANIVLVDRSKDAN